MGELRIGDVVARKSYGMDIMFKVADIKNDGNRKIVVLKGICYRIEADAPEEDLVVQSEQDISHHNMEMSRKIDRKFRQMAMSSQMGYQKK
ncbi:MAG: YabG peptidase U57 [Clostridia bacterium]|nr:YabG peptidase U57 [Clostridia bacterium]